MQNKNLLVITDGFPQGNKYNCNFVKSYVDLVKDDFDKVYVISPQPYLPKFLIKSKLLKNFARFSGFTDYKYENVRVFYPSFWMLPIRWFRKKRGDFFSKKCKQVIQKNKLKFDLIHTHFLFPSAYAGIILKEKYHKPIIVTAHGSDTYKEPFLNEFNFKRAKNILDKVDLITVPSEFMVQKVKEINPAIKNKINLIPNFIDINLFKIKVKKENRIKKILMVGNLIESKGYLKLIPTVKNLLKIRQDFVVQIIGEGYLKSVLKKEIQTNQLEKFIQILGAKPNRELVNYYNQADVFFFPSESESFGIVQIEALVCGVPVIAAPNEGSKSIIKKELGLLSKTFSPKEYADLINQALNQKWNKEELKKYVIQNFSREKTKEKLLEIYFNLSI